MIYSCTNDEQHRLLFRAVHRGALSVHETEVTNLGGGGGRIVAEFFTGFQDSSFSPNCAEHVVDAGFGS